MIVLKKYNIEEQGYNLIIKNLSKDEREKILKLVEKKSSLKTNDFILDIDTITEYLRSQQRKTIYSLLDCFIKSGCSSFDTIEELKEEYKNKLGEIKGYEYLLSEDVFNFIKSNKNLNFHFVKNREEIPQNAVRYYTVYKSLNDLTKEKANQTITLIIQDMIRAGVNTELFQIIIKGLEKAGEDYKKYINSYQQLERK